MSEERPLGWVCPDCKALWVDNDPEDAPPHPAECGPCGAVMEQIGPVMPLTEHEQRVGELQARAENAEADYQALREAVEEGMPEAIEAAMAVHAEAEQGLQEMIDAGCSGGDFAEVETPMASATKAALDSLATILGEGGKRLEDWEQDEARKLAADLQMVWLIRVKNVLEPKALLCLDPDQARGWQETGAEVVPYVPAGKPSPDCKEGEGGEPCKRCGGRGRLLAASDADSGSENCAFCNGTGSERVRLEIEALAADCKEGEGS